MKIIFKIFGSFFLAALVLIGFEVLLEFGLEHNRNFKISYIQRHPVKAELLVHGPCESEWMIDPAVLESYVPMHAYNLSLNHSDFADNYIFLTTYLKHQPKPKAVLLYVTPESFDSTVANTFNTYRFAHLLSDKDVAAVVQEMDPQYYQYASMPFLKYAYYSNFTFYKAISGWFDFFRKRTTPEWPNGYAAPAHSYDRAFKSFRDLNPKAGYFLWSAKREKYFRKIIELLKKEHIPLMVYEAPVYHEALAYQKNRSSHIRRIDSICTAYNIANFRFDTLSMRFNKDYYFSTYNTTMAGNAIFNPYLGKFLRDTLPAVIQNHQQ